MEKLNLPAFAGGKNDFKYKFTKALKGDTCVPVSVSFQWLTRTQSKMELAIRYQIFNRRASMRVQSTNKRLEKNTSTFEENF